MSATLVGPAWSHAQQTTEPTPPPDFATCVAELKTLAKAENVSTAVVSDVLDRVQQSERVLELDRSQPEFTQTFAGYFYARVTPERVAKGRAMLAAHRPLLESLQAETGVPPHYLLAFWGLETNFGGYLGSLWVPDSLTTLACDERRGRYFTSELIAALRIIDQGHVSADAMVGSWAGAMGQVQFMPTAYLRYAVDRDGDGRRDLWGSTEDALASAANFVETLGWRRGERWGREVSLPSGFDYRTSPPGTTRKLTEWRALALHDAFGATLPDVDLAARLVLPAGHRGPGFLAYPNFDVIMRWNRSEFYALTVGHLADRIAGAGALAKPPPDDEIKFSTAELTRIQHALGALGYDAGEPDGRLGPTTRRAVMEFQLANGLVADGHLDTEVVQRLTESGR